MMPVTGIAGGNNQGGNDSVIPAYLLAQAQANPNAMFAVIVTGSHNQSSDSVAQNVQQNGDFQGNNGQNGQNGNSGQGKDKLGKRFRSISGVSASLSGKDILKLAKQGKISAIVPDERVRTAAIVGSLPSVTNSTWRAAAGVSALLFGLGISAPQAPTIAIVDSGIDSSKSLDFGNRIVARANFVSTEPDATGDPVGHGTMVAGIAAGSAPVMRGVATNANLVDVRVADSQGMAMTSDVIAGIDWILQNKAAYNIRVANFSLAGRPGTTIRFDPLDQAVEKLWLNGVVVVAAAGNNGSATGPVAMPAPGNDPFVITVGAVDVNGTSNPADDFRAPWSAYGFTADGFAKPELSAPGRYMTAPVPMGSYLASMKPERITANGYMWMSGTSFSAPVVAGAAAQILARHPDWSPDQVKGALMATARKTSSGSVGTGIGELYGIAAASAGSTPNPNDGLNAFVTVDPISGLFVFDASNWTATVSSNWVASNWVASNWVEGTWSASNWTSASLTASNWVASNWVESNWVESNWVE